MKNKELRNFVRQLIDEGEKHRSNPDLEKCFVEYYQKVINICTFIKANTDDYFILKKIDELSLININPSYLFAFLRYITVLKFNYNYLSNWKKAGKYLYLIDRINLLLSSIENYILKEMLDV